MPGNPPTVSIIVPVRDEADNLRPLYDRITTELAGEPERLELLFVNDGSRDTSLTVMRELQAEDSRVSVLDLSRDFGREAAISAGMEHASGDAAVVLGADLEDPPEVIPEMLRRWREGHDVVYAMRSGRPREGLLRRASAKLVHRLLRAATSLDVPADTGDFRLVSRRVLEVLSRMPERHRFVRGMVAWVGFRTAAVTYPANRRRSGARRYPLGNTVRAAWEGVLSFSTAPLRLASWAGLAALAAVAVALGAILLLGRSPHLAEVAVLTAAFFGGLQLLSVGLLGAYLGRAHEEVKARPSYVVDEWLPCDARAAPPTPRAVPAPVRTGLRATR